MSNKLLAAAYKYISNGICVIATKKNKRAIFAWTEFQETIITQDQVELQFEHDLAHSLAIITGKSSGNLEVVDIDTKYDLTGTLYDRYVEAIKENFPGLFERLLVVRTVSGGYHFYYRCPVIEGNQKLAMRFSSPDEMLANVDDRQKVLIETRGDKGYVIAPPSEGYATVQGKNIPTITEGEREVLLSLARSFNEVVEETGREQLKSSSYNAKEYGLSPFDDYNKRGDIKQLLSDHGWLVTKDNSSIIIFRRPGKDEGTSGNFNKEKNWFSVFSTSTVFEIRKAYKPAAVFCKLECNDSWTECAKKLLELGFGEKREFFGDKLEKQLYKKMIDGQSIEQLEQFLVSAHKKTPEQAKEIIEKLTRIWGEKICTFWDISETGRVSINRANLIKFLYNTGGFSLYYYDTHSTIYKIVQCQNGFITDVSTEHIKKFILNYINSLPPTFDNNLMPSDIEELILKGSDTFFSNSLMEFLSRGQFNFLKDTEREAFFTFRNGVVKVTGNKMDLLQYSDIKKVIWRSQVIDFDILLEPDLVLSTTEYFKFITAICNSDNEREAYAMTLIGYMLHKYKDPTKAFAIILAEETENEKEGGGTGKGIFFKAISKLINTVTIDGKAFKQDKSFAFQRVGLDTKLVVLEDVKKNVEFEGFYPMITEGMTVEKKNKDELFIPYADSPKIGFTTNYNVNAVGNHGKRRQKVFEFAPFFKPGNSPEDFFGHKLFDDWDTDEWNRFYNLMFLAVQAYFEGGILEVSNSEKIKRKQIRLNYTDEFLEWWDENFPALSRGFGMQMEYYKDFISSSELEPKDYSFKRFKSALLSATDVFGCALYQCKNRVANNARMICIRKIGEPEPKKHDSSKNVSDFEDAGAEAF